MEMRLMEYAVEVCRKKSFTKAAASLHIAQPSLSQQIKSLERKLGVRLFVRGHGEVVPTPDGVRFLDHAEKILRMRDDLEREMNERSEGMRRELTIGAPAITGGHVLPPLLQAFGVRYPQVRVRLIEESPDKLEDLTARGMVDLSILSLPIEDSRLTTRGMFTEPLLLALPRTEKEWMSETVRQLVKPASHHFQDHPLQEDGNLSLSVCSGAPFILLKRGFGFRRVVLELCAESGFQPQIIYETSSIETAQSLVAHGLGVTLVPNMVVRHHAQPKPLYLPIDSHPTRTLVFVYLKERYLSLAARALLDTYYQEVQRAR
ncbi:LysR family transcriptional regulator [Salinithrix halophila]|uniref:LysR family transcriptional regulator n=1 Tax=Salinithrix halophila TaxID=1485204 RepID=A0ABV8JDP8_9BACL